MKIKHPGSIADFSFGRRIIEGDRWAAFTPQVTVHYEQKEGAVIPKRVHTIVISVQHDDYISLEEQKRVLKEKVAHHQNTERILSERYVKSVTLMLGFLW